MPREVVYKPVEKIDSKVSAPLELKQKNVIDYILKYGRKISLRVNTDGISDKNIYTVPEGKTFFLLNVSISADIDNGNYAKIFGESADDTLIQVTSQNAIGITPVTLSNSFPIPFRYHTSERINATSTTSKSICCINGYEVNTADIF